MNSRLIIIFLIFLGLSQALNAQSIKLNPQLVSGGNILSAEITPDGRYVLYTADQETDGITELYRIPINGGTPVKMNLDISISTGDVQGYTISPDSQYLVYWGNITNAYYDELYSVPIEGGVTHRLNCRTRDLQVLSRGGPSIVQGVSITPDSQRVVFEHDHLNFLEFRIYSAPIDEDAPTTFDPNSSSPRFLCGREGTLEMTPYNVSTRQPIIKYEISPDSEHIVYSYSSFDDDDSRLYSSNLNSLGATMLNSNAQIGGRQLFTISPDSNSVVFSAETNNNGLFSLYSTGIDVESNPISLNTTTLEASWKYDFNPAITADSQRVVYTSKSLPTEPYQLYSVPIDASSPPLNLYPETLFGFGSASSFDNLSFKLSPDTQSVVYTRDHDTRGLFDLYFLNSTDSTTNPVRLTNLPLGNREIKNFYFSPDGSRVVYKGEMINDNQADLFSVSINGGESIKLNPDLENDQDVADYRITPNGAYTLFEIGSDNGRQIDGGLFAIPTAGGDLIQVHDNLINGGTITSFTISEQGNQVVYLADIENSGTRELYLFELPELPTEDEICLPIKAKNNSIAVICL